MAALCISGEKECAMGSPITPITRVVERMFNRSIRLKPENLIVAGAFLFGLMITLFSIASKQFGSYSIALILMFFIGASGSTYMISIMNSLQIMVPDHMRGRVMGFYGMTWNIMPLGAIYSGSLAGMFGEGGNGVPIAVALGGILVALFAIGPAALNKNLRLATDINRSG